MNLYCLNKFGADEIIASLRAFAERESLPDYYAAARGLLKFSAERAYSANTVAEYAVRLIVEDETLISYGEDNPFFKSDIEKIYELIFAFDWDALCQKCGVLPISHISPKTRPDESAGGYVASIMQATASPSADILLSRICEHCKKYGTGNLAAYSALKWEDGKLVGITGADKITFDDLTGLDAQKKILIENTRAFMLGKPSNNVLLVGSSGTGKSSCVKACMNMFGDDGLRLVEIAKTDLPSLPKAMNILKNKTMKYIIFIDDLSFEHDDISYKQLKVALDGQIEKRADNILIYATSNRRNLVRETSADRSGAYEDIHQNDTVNEKVSLSRRFGINLYFMSPNQTEYIKIVENLLKAEGIEVTDEILARARSWAVNYNGRSGRTARQFVDDLLGHM